MEIFKIYNELKVEMKIRDRYSILPEESGLYKEE